MQPFMTNDRKQIPLFTPTLEEAIPPHHPARFIEEVVGQLDTSAIEAKYSHLGRKAFHPKALLSLLFYGYYNGLRSSRQLAEKCVTDIAYKFLISDIPPDFRTISDFRKNNLDEIRKAFREIVLMGKEMGLGGGNLLFIDGTKIHANASAKKTKKKDYLAEEIRKLEEGIQNTLQEAEDIDEKEDAIYGESSGYELPEHLANKSERMRRIKEAKRRLKAKQANDSNPEEAEDSEDENSHEAGTSEDLASKTKRLQRLKAAKDVAEKKGWDKVNITDVDARFMKQRHGVIRPAYNCQSAVAEDGFIVAQEVVMEANDANQLEPMTEQVLEMLPEKSCVVADGDYGSYGALEYLEKKGLEGYVRDLRGDIREVLASNRKKEARYNRLNFKYDKGRDCFICPEGKELPYDKRTRSGGREKFLYRGRECCSCRVRKICTKNEVKTITADTQLGRLFEMLERFRSEEGWEIYKKRLPSVEAPFGDMKKNRGFTQFELRGSKKAGGEFALVCIGHNLKKLWGKLKEAKAKGIGIKEMVREAMERVQEKAKGIKGSLSAEVYAVG